MPLKSLNQQGVIHHLILPLAAVVLIVGGTFVVVTHANHSKQSNLASQSTATKSKLTSNETNTTGGAQTATTQGSPASPTTPAASTTTSKTSTSAKTTASTSSNPPAASPAPTPAPAPTPLSTLTTIIANLQSNSAQAQVTNSLVDVAGPISTAHARPIVFTLNGQTYYAYKQGSASNFNTSAADTANSMAIITVSGSGAATGSAHLNKSNQLVDADSLGTNVGYSTGGN